MIPPVPTGGGKIVCSGIDEYNDEESLVCGGVGLRLRLDEEIGGGGGRTGVLPSDSEVGGLNRSLPILKGSRHGMEACSLSSCGVMVL